MKARREGQRKKRRTHTVDWRRLFVGDGGAAGRRGQGRRAAATARSGAVYIAGWAARLVASWQRTCWSRSGRRRRTEARRQLQLSDSCWRHVAAAAAATAAAAAASSKRACPLRRGDRTRQGRARLLRRCRRVRSTPSTTVNCVLYTVCRMRRLASPQGTFSGAAK
eukprot:COSAG02_NODE_497_length_21092_cov_43.948650_3_plen_166_part_00